MDAFAFDLADLDGSGQLNLQQLHEACCIGGCNLSQGQVAALCEVEGVRPPIDRTQFKSLLAASLMAKPLTQDSLVKSLSVLDPSNSKRVEFPKLCHLLTIYGAHRFTEQEVGDFQAAAGLVGTEEIDTTTLAECLLKRLVTNT